MSGKRTIAYTSVAIITAFIIGTLTSEPIVEAASGWKEAIENLQAQIDAIPETQVYEISDTAVMLEGETISTAAQLRCLDDDWFDDQLGISANPSLETQGLTITVQSIDNIREGSLGPNSDIAKIIGKDVTIDIVNPPGAAAPFDITFTITTLCRIPLP